MRRILLPLAVGGVLAFALCVLLGGTVADAAGLVALASGAALVAALAGFAVLQRMGDAPVGRQAVVVSLVAVGATAIGAAAASWAMFLSEHDLDALAVVLVAAGSVGVGAAFELGHRITAGSRELGELAQRIGDGAMGADTTGDGVGAERGDATGDPSPSPRRSAPSELTRLREELASMAQRLDESRRRERDQESARRELIAWVSHDLRSPLAGIRAMAEAMEDGVVDDPATVQRYLRTIGEESQRLSRLVDDLFELARIHQGTLQLHPEEVALGDLVSDVVAGAAPVADARGVRLVGEADGLPPILVSTPELGRVLQNLLDNAIRHTPAGGVVAVRGACRPDGVLLSVVDECGGIPADDLVRVFEVAFRGDVARRRDEAGGGLGLAIAKGLVEAHDGDLTVENHERGCCFTIRLPATAEPAGR